MWGTLSVQSNQEGSQHSAKEIPNEKTAPKGGPSKTSIRYLHPDYFTTVIDPNVPARLLLGPAVKNNSFVDPLFAEPPPNSIPQS